MNGCECRSRCHGAQMVLYTARGDSALYVIRAKLSHRFAGQPLCKLTMMRSDAVTFEAAAAPDSTCKAIVQSAEPHRIVALSSEFETLYGMTHAETLHHALGIIQGPRTDMRSWRALLQGALRGFTQQATLRTYARDATLVPQIRMSATPVLGKRGIEFILVRIGPSLTDVAEPDGFEVEEEEQRRRLSRALTPLSAAVRPGPECPQDCCDNRAKRPAGHRCVTPAAADAVVLHITTALIVTFVVCTLVSLLAVHSALDSLQAPQF